MYTSLRHDSTWSLVALVMFAIAGCPQASLNDSIRPSAADDETATTRPPGERADAGAASPADGGSNANEPSSGSSNC